MISENMFETMVDHTKWMIMAAMSSEQGKVMWMKCMKIHQIIACDQKFRKSISMSEKSIVSTVIVPNRLKAMADDGNHSEVAVIWAVVSITENVIRLLIERDRCERQTRVKDPMMKNMSPIQMPMRAFIDLYQLKREVCKEDQEKVAVHHHGTGKEIPWI